MNCYCLNYIYNVHIFLTILSLTKNNINQYNLIVKYTDLKLVSSNFIFYFSKLHIMSSNLNDYNVKEIINYFIYSNSTQICCS